MRYAQITPFEVCNGKGAGVSLFTQGCHFQCKGCFNQNAWDFCGGKEWTKEVENKFFELIDRPYIKRISILGGEPLANENAHTVLSLLKKIKNRFPEKSIWLYTGYTFEEICDYFCNQSLYNLLRNAKEHNIWSNIQYINVLVDGKFIEEEKDITLLFRGSKNQRLIDMQKSIKEQKIVLYNN